MLEKIFSRNYELFFFYLEKIRFEIHKKKKVS